MRISIIFIVFFFAGCAAKPPTLPYPERTYQPCSTVDDCVQVIAHAVANNWSRSSAVGDGLKATVTLLLDYEAELEDVYIVISSGNNEFDKNTVEAVKLAAPFPELLGLARDDYIEHFTSIKFVFRPEDLGR